MTVRRIANPLVVKKNVEGQSFRMAFTGTNGEPIDCSTYLFKTDLKYKAGDTPIASLTNGNGGFTITGEGVPVMNISKSVLDLVEVDLTDNSIPYPFANVYFDVEYDDGSGQWKAYVMGCLRVYEGFTDE